MTAWLPAVVPSWRFFDRIGPAPRIEFSLTAGDDLAAESWRALRPRPASVAVGVMIQRLFWNPVWNETLYLTSCAERLLEDPTRERAEALWTRAAGVVRDTHDTHRPAGAAADRCLRLRIVETVRQGDRLVSDVAYVSEPRRLVGDGGADAP